MSDPYVVLGLPRDAPSRQVVETYRALAQIYHPDRYVEAPARVRDEATRRMQELNAAFAELQKRHGTQPRPAATTHDTARRPRPPDAPPTRQPTPPPPPPPTTTVLYVDGTGRYHSQTVAPLGFVVEDEDTKRTADAPQCGRLNAELLEWFRLQRASATMVDKLMFEAWSRDQQAMYAATMGCTRVPLEKVRGFGSPCTECEAPTAA